MKRYAQSGSMFESVQRFQSMILQRMLREHVCDIPTYFVPAYTTSRPH